MDRKKTTALRFVDAGYGLTRTTAFCPAASWTHKVDGKEKKKHDFSNLLLEFKYAIERQDQMLMEYCDSELERMYRERWPTPIRQSSAQLRRSARPQLVRVGD